jgi:hypothetical protein
MSKNKINFKINFITKLKFKIVIIVKRKLGNPVLDFSLKIFIFLLIWKIKINNKIILVIKWWVKKMIIFLPRKVIENKLNKDFYNIKINFLEWKQISMKKKL